MPDDVGSWRHIAFVGAFLLLGALESVRPALPLTGNLGTRWTSHLGLYAINTGLGIGLGAIGLPGLNPGPWALFPPLTDGLPDWARLGVAVLALDLFAYATHVLFHRAVPLWWLHGVHHADIDLDVTTGFRHHPGEMVLTAALGIVFALTIGVPPALWATYAILATIVVLIQHANLRLPERLDHALSWVLVTPGMHRHHHATQRAVHDNNYGTLFSVWDRIFGTYHTSTATVRDSQPIGLDGLGAPADQRLDGTLLMPLRLFSRNSP